MDRTALFKASVKTIRTKNKALGVKEPVKDSLRLKRKRSAFETKAKDVVSFKYEQAREKFGTIWKSKSIEILE